MANINWDEYFSEDNQDSQNATPARDVGNGQVTDVPGNSSINWDQEFSAPSDTQTPAPETTQSEHNVGLPTPTPNMFADMDDSDAAEWYKAYENSPDTTKDDQGNLLYRGQVVPQPEGGWFTDALNKAAGQTLGALGPIGGAAEMADGILPGAGYVRDTLTGGLGGIYNAGRNIAKVGANLIDITPGGPSDEQAAELGISASPATDFVDQNIPAYNPQGTAQHVGAGAGEIGTGIALGNELGATLKAAGMAAPAVAKVLEAAPKTVDFITSLVGSSIGVTGAVNENSDTAVTGKNAFVHLIDGLDTSDPNAAMAGLKKRVNILVDNIILGGAVYGGAKILKTLGSLGYQAMGKQIHRLASQSAERNGIIEEIIDKAKSVTGASTPEQIQSVNNTIQRILSDKNNAKIVYDVGIEGVDNPEVALDTASTFSKGADLNNPQERALTRMFRQERKKVIFPTGKEADPGSRTLEAAERPAEALNKLTTQTAEAFGKGDTVQRAAELTQKEAQTQSDVQKVIANAKAKDAENTLNTMGENVHRFRDLKREGIQQAYNDIPAATPADHSFNDLASGMNLPKNLRKIIDASDGTFKYLNGTVRKAINSELDKVFQQLRRSPGDKDLEGLADDLKSLKDNIDIDQPTALIDEGNYITAQARDKAIQTFKENELPYRQGVTQDLEDIANKFGPDNTTDLPEQTREALRPVVEKPIQNSERYAQLEDVLSSEEGGKSRDLLTKFKSAKEEEAAAKELASDAFKNRFREFFDKFTTGTKLPSGINSFNDLVTNPQGLDRVKEILRLSKTKNLPVLNKALKSAYAEAIDDILFKGDISQTGAEKVSKVAGSLERDKALLDIGKEIYSDIPQWHDAMKGLLEASKLVNADNFLRATKSGDIDFVKAEGMAAVNKIIRLWKGPLTKAGTRYNTLASAIIKIIKPQEMIARMRDEIMSDPEQFMKAWRQYHESTRARPPTARSVVQGLVAMGIFNDGDRNRFEQEYDKINNFDNQSHSVFDDIKKGALKIERQTEDLFR